MHLAFKQVTAACRAIGQSQHDMDVQAGLAVIADSHVAEATFHLKGVTLHAREASPEMGHSIHALAEDVARQVKKHRDLRRNRRLTRKITGQLRGRPAV